MTDDLAPDAELYVPGEFRCAKCGFHLSQFSISAATGAISDRDHSGEKCPNDGAPLWRVTWKQRAQDHYERAADEISINAMLKAALNAAASAMEAEAVVLQSAGLAKSCVEALERKAKIARDAAK